MTYSNDHVMRMCAPELDISRPYRWVSARVERPGAWCGENAVTHTYEVLGHRLGVTVRMDVTSSVCWELASERAERGETVFFPFRYEMYALDGRGHKVRDMMRGRGETGDEFVDHFLDGIQASELTSVADILASDDVSKARKTVVVETMMEQFLDLARMSKKGDMETVEGIVKTVERLWYSGTVEDWLKEGEAYSVFEDDFEGKGE